MRNVLATLKYLRRRLTPVAGPRAALIHRSERSILDAPDSLIRYPPYSALGRRRQATCSGVAWLPGGRLAVVNLYGQHLRIYQRVDDAQGRPRALALQDERSGVTFPENLAATADGRVLAIVHSLSREAGLSLQRLDSDFRPEGPARMLRPGLDASAFHGVAFSPDGRFLVCGVVGESATIEVISLADEQMTWRRTAAEGLLGHPKAMAFTPDSRHLVVGYASIVKREDCGRLPGAWIAVHAFDSTSGRLEPEPLVRLQLEGRESPFLECLALRSVGEASRTMEVFASIQAADRIDRFELDLAAASLRPAGVGLAVVSFAHGVSVSPDGAWLAATSYGEDTLHIRAL